MSQPLALTSALIRLKEKSTVTRRNAGKAQLCSRLLRLIDMSWCWRSRDLTGMGVPMSKLSIKVQLHVALATSCKSFGNSQERPWEFGTQLSLFGQTACNGTVEG